MFWHVLNADPLVTLQSESWKYGWYLEINSRSLLMNLDNDYFYTAFSASFGITRVSEENTSSKCPGKAVRAALCWCKGGSEMMTEELLILCQRFHGSFWEVDSCFSTAENHCWCKGRWEAGASGELCKPGAALVGHFSGLLLWKQVRSERNGSYCFQSNINSVNSGVCEMVLPVLNLAVRRNKVRHPMLPKDQVPPWLAFKLFSVLQALAFEGQCCWLPGSLSGEKQIEICTWSCKAALKSLLLSLLNKCVHNTLVLVGGWISWGRPLFLLQMFSFSFPMHPLAAKVLKLYIQY